MLIALKRDQDGRADGNKEGHPCNAQRSYDRLPMPIDCSTSFEDHHVDYVESNQEKLHRQYGEKP
jgi:hypothetical protein